MSTPRTWSRTSTILGWAIAILGTAMSLLTTRLPRTEKTSLLREDLRGWHYLLGIVLCVLAAWRLWRWWRERPVAPAPGMTAAGHRWACTLAIAVYALLALNAPVGFLQATFEGLTVRLGPLATLPAAAAPNHLGWQFFGYFHSAAGFVSLLLMTATTLTAAWFWLRRGVGPLAAFAPGFGLQAVASFLNSVYALNSFRAPEPGVRAVLIVLAAGVGVWALGAWLARRRRAASPAGVGRIDDGTGSGGTGSGSGSGAADRGRTARPGRLAAAASVLAIAGLVGFGLYGPHLLFRVTPWPMGEVIADPSGATSHAGPVTTVSVLPETAFERTVRAETYKWCRFCHTVEKGGRHLVGPNLYAIFGQRAGTVPNFHYSEAMARAGREGLVWTDETIAEYIAGPDRFLPGTSMIISSGPVKTPEERAAIVNILKRETMPPEAIVAASPVSASR